MNEYQRESFFLYVLSVGFHLEMEVMQMGEKALCSLTNEVIARFHHIN